MNDRHDEGMESWPARPWIMAAMLALGGLAFFLLADPDRALPVSALRQAAAAVVVIGSVSFALTVERRRLSWALAFALSWGAVIALVGWSTASYNQQPDIFEFPFLSGVAAVLLATPLFQTARDEGTWRLPYPRLYRHAWTDAVIGAASLAFVGLTFLLAWLIAGLFDVIGISGLKDLLKTDWFAWMLAGFAFGGAVGLLRERNSLVATLQRLVMVVLSVLAPVLAAALVAFLLSIPFTGLSRLWDASIPATSLMLAAAAGAVLLVNAVIGTGTEDDRSSNRVLCVAALALLLCVLPLAIIAAVSLGQRIGQYGWTPERIWGVVAVAVAFVYGLAGWWAVASGRGQFDDRLRPLQTRLALGLCALALALALPILDFGAISARSQMSRYAAGRVEAKNFDWQAMAFDFGPAGRAQLAAIARTGTAEHRRLAATALAAKNRYHVDDDIAAVDNARDLDQHMRVIPAGTALSPQLRAGVAGTGLCRAARCVVLVADPGHVLVAGTRTRKESVQRVLLTPDFEDRWSSIEGAGVPRPARPAQPDLANAPVELRRVERRILFIDGKPVGDAFQ